MKRPSRNRGSFFIFYSMFFLSIFENQKKNITMPWYALYTESRQEKKVAALRAGAKTGSASASGSAGSGSLSPDPSWAPLCVRPTAPCPIGGVAPSADRCAPGDTPTARPPSSLAPAPCRHCRTPRPASPAHTGIPAGSFAPPP